MRETRVLLAEDDPFTREALRDYLETRGQVKVVGLARDGHEAVELFKGLEDETDLVILDIRMPRLDGIQAAARIKQLSPGVKILLLTSSTEEQHVLEGLKTGIHGYILKSEPSSLLNAIEAVMNGRIVCDPIVNETLGRQWKASMPQELTMLQIERRIDALAREKDLTAREKEILRLVCLGKSNAQVAELLCITEDTVKKHLTHLLQKCGCRSRTECIALILKGEAQ
ncbi:MAG: response regulator transcription factor [Bacillota bacterium]|nr:response regulator transcription factor [Bacillota bacterium]